MKPNKNQSEQLEARIQTLEIKRNVDYLVLKDELNKTYNELKPSSLLYRVLVDIKKEPKIKDNLLENILSIAGGYLSKKIFIGKSNNLFKNIIGYAFQFISTKIISKNFNK
jgi:hypothetical protein